MFTGFSLGVGSFGVFRPDTFLVTGVGEYGEAEDDFAREDGFYDHALDAIQQATKMLKKNKIPIVR